MLGYHLLTSVEAGAKLVGLSHPLRKSCDLFIPSIWNLPEEVYSEPKLMQQQHPSSVNSQSTPVLVKMWEPVSLPFKNSSLPLPTLPTTDEIRSCSDILWERCYDKIVAVNDKVVVKFGGSVNAWEGQALMYLEKHVPPSFGSATVRDVPRI